MSHSQKRRSDAFASFNGHSGITGQLAEVKLVTALSYNCRVDRNPMDSRPTDSKGSNDTTVLDGDSLDERNLFTGHAILATVWSRHNVISVGRWYVIICECFSDFIHRLYSNKITTFRNLDLLLSSGKKE
jgi:hypothetical protein